MAQEIQILNLKEDLNIEVDLKNIWKNYYQDSNEPPFSPLYQEKVRKNAVTFLSLNPSLINPEEAKKGYEPDIPYPMIDCCKQKADYRFFQKFYDLGKNLKSWTFLDLLYERESEQDNLLKRYKKDEMQQKDKDFLFGQIKLTFKIIEQLNPRLVIICSKAARYLIEDNIRALGLNQELPTKENNNIYRINGIPFITNESQFLGSRILSTKVDRREKLLTEIGRVMGFI